MYNNKKTNTYLISTTGDNEFNAEEVQKKTKQIIHISIVNIYVKNFFPAKSCNSCRLNLAGIEMQEIFFMEFQSVTFSFP